MSFTCSTLLRCECRGHASCAFDLDFAPQNAGQLCQLQSFEAAWQQENLICITANGQTAYAWCAGGGGNAE